MPNYKETPVNGSQWTRCSEIVINNAYGRTPTIQMKEEQLTSLGGEMFQKPAQGLNIQFDPAATIPLLDPRNGNSLGTTMTQQEIHIALWSLYMQKAQERDANLLVSQ